MLRLLSLDDPRIGVVLRVCLLSGMRAGEAVGLVREDLIWKTDDTLMVIATTAGRGAEGLAADQFNYAVRVAKGEVVKPNACSGGWCRKNC